MMKEEHCFTENNTRRGHACERNQFILIVLAGRSGIGYLTADLKRHLNDLKCLRRILLLLKEEIAYTHAPLEEAFARISRKVKAPYCLFCWSIRTAYPRRAGSSFAEIWSCAVEERLCTTKLTREELEELKEFGNSIGYLGGHAQEGAIDLYLEQLKVEVQDVQEGLGRRKLCSCLGVMSGIFITIFIDLVEEYAQCSAYF